MPKPDKARRKELRRAYKETENSAAREYLGIAPGDLSSLLDYLDDHLQDSTCDHTLRLTQEWTRAHGHNEATITNAVRAFGGYCDCEVLANVTPDKFGWPG